MILGWARRRWRQLLISAIGIFAVCFGLGGISLSAAAQSGPTGLVGAWTSSPQVALNGDPVYSNQTLRLIVFPHFGGNSFRVRLSNVLGSQALTIGQADIAQLSSGATTVAGTDHVLTFGGQASVTIPAGSEVASDFVTTTVQANQGLVVSVYVPGSTGLPTWHRYSQETSYVASGNHAADSVGTAYQSTSDTSWWFVDGIDVVGSGTGAAPYAVVALGDSLTDGLGTGANTNTRWTDDLSGRLTAQAGNAASVLNQGISGDRVLADSPCYGQSALNRLSRDVLGQPGVAYVVLYEGINDLAGAGARGSACSGPVTTDATAAQLISGYQQIISSVHQRGLKIYGATLTPFGGSSIYNSTAESQRQSVNQWVRTSNAFDAVLDFDAVVRDPNAPSNLLSTYDSSDHIHLNAAGYKAEANSINLALFGPPAAAAAVNTAPTNTPTPLPTNTPTTLPTNTPTAVPANTTAPPASSPPGSSTFSDGFESGTFGAWSSTATTGSGSAIVSTTAPFAGSYDGLFSRSTTTEVADKAAAVERFTPPAGNVTWGRAWVRFESVPSVWYWNIDNVLQLDDGTNLDHPKARFGAHNGGRLFYSYLRKDGTWYAGEWGALTLGAYYGLKIEFDTSGANPVITWFVDTGAGWTQVATYTDTSSGTAVPANQVRVGASTDSGIANSDPSYAGTAQNRVDQVAVSPTDPDASSAQTASAPPAASPPGSSIFSDGFESGTFGAWSSTATSGSGSASVSTTAPFAGSYDGLFSRSTTTEVADKAAAVERFTPPAGKVTWGRAWVRFETVPSVWYWNIDNVLQLDDGANLNHPKARFGAHNGGKLFYSYLRKDGTWYAGEWGPLTPGAYYGLKIEFDTSGANPVITWFVDTGSAWAQVATYTDTSSGPVVSPNEIRVGASTDSGIANGDPSYAGTAQNRVDQVAVSAIDPN